MFAKSLTGGAGGKAMMGEEVVSQLGKRVSPLKQYRHHACPTHRAYVAFKFPHSTLNTSDLLQTIVERSSPDHVI
jgi:hypothetical protein